MTMKNISFIPILFVFSACNLSNGRNVLPAKPTPDSPGKAELKFLEKKIDFGNVPDDTVLTGKYDFINTSKDTLFITSVNPDCTCTGYKLNKNKIAPNDSGYITLQVSTKNKTGAVVLYSTISANTPTKFYSLKMMANVR